MLVASALLPSRSPKSVTLGGDLLLQPLCSLARRLYWLLNQTVTFAACGVLIVSQQPHLSDLSGLQFQLGDPFSGSEEQESSSWRIIFAICISTAECLIGYLRQ